MQRANTIADIKDSIDMFDPPYLDSIRIQCTPDTFMEILINNIRNDVISYQRFVNKRSKQIRTDLINKIVTEKAVIVPDHDLIDRLESNLNTLLDNELNTEIEKHKIFEHVNMEKMTPQFLKIAKSSRPDSKLDDIRKPDGSNFDSEADQKEFIVTHFENIYKLPVGAIANVEGCIERFLGDELLAHPIVQNSKITNHDRAILEQEINLAELDFALSEVKLKTASGPDGLSNSFIKKYWKFFRLPLCKYSNYCFQMGSLSPSFKTAQIRLIPKKGDCSKIGDWRPISLMNCIYKIISKAINNRLKKISDTITSRAQKGFTSARYIQEVLINVIEGIGHCNTNGIPGFVLSLDQSKAFDAVRHNYLVEVYKFFGMGDNFINMLNVITTGRNACIIFEDNSLSRQFNLDTVALRKVTLLPQSNIYLQSRLQSLSLN